MYIYHGICNCMMQTIHEKKIKMKEKIYNNFQLFYARLKHLFLSSEKHNISL